MTEVRRVLQVSARFFPDMGGTETHMYETTRRLNAMPGLKVDVLTTDRTGQRPSTEVVNGTTIQRVMAWPRERDYYIAPAVASVIRRGGYDIVHCQGVQTAVPLIAMATARRLRVPYVVTPHTGGHSSKLRHAVRGAQWRAIGPLIRDAQRLICVAEFEMKMFSRASRISPDRVCLIPNGVSVERPSPDAIPLPDKPIIVCVGRLERYKGQHRLIAAMPRLLEQDPRIQLILVGKGPYESALREEAERLGVAESVTFTHIPPANRVEMADLVARAHVVALLSDYEAHPLAVMEAVALGRPVVVAPGSGLGELADNQLALAVSDPDDPDAVAKALLAEMTTEHAEPVDSPTSGSGRLPTWDHCSTELARIYREIK